MGMIGTSAALASNIGMGMNARTAMMTNSNQAMSALNNPQVMSNPTAAANLDKQLQMSNLQNSLLSKVSDAQQEALQKRLDSSIKRSFSTTA